MGPHAKQVCSFGDESSKDSVRFELSDQTRQAIDDYLKAANKRPGEFLFAGHRGPNRSMTTRQYARLVSEWIGSVGLARIHCAAQKQP